MPIEARACSGSPGIGLGCCRLLLEADDAAVGVDLHHAELPAAASQVDPQGADRHVGLRLDVPLDQLHVVHLVDVVAGEDRRRSSGRSFSMV